MLKKLVVKAIDFYQQYLNYSLPRTCRFWPTCSEYAKEAILKYGLAKGIYLALKRILLCQPFIKRDFYYPLE